MKNKITDKLFNLAYTDSMTELANRNAYEEHLKKLRRDNANLQNITVVVVDINDLKQINDSFGHHTGDEAIKTIADILKDTIGKKADVYRIGGDEFVCISENNPFPYIAQFRDTVSFANRDKIYKLSVSVGYTTFNGKYNKTIDDLIKYADMQMYKDKKKQR